MKRKLFFFLFLLISICGVSFSQNRLSNTSWEATGMAETDETYLQFGNNSFKLTIGKNGGYVGTYEVKGDSITFREGTVGLTFQGTLLGNTLTVGFFGANIELHRVQPGANSQSDSKNNSGTQNSTSTVMAQDFFNSGLSYYDKGDYDRAIADYTQAIKLNPNYSEAYNNRGVVYQDKGNKSLAIADYRTAVRLDPNEALYRDNLKNLRGY